MGEGRRTIVRAFSHLLASRAGDIQLGGEQDGRVGEGQGRTEASMFAGESGFGLASIDMTDSRTDSTVWMGNQRSEACNHYAAIVSGTWMMQMSPNRLESSVSMGTTVFDGVHTPSSDSGQAALQGRQGQGITMKVGRACFKNSQACS